MMDLVCGLRLGFATNSSSCHSIVIDKSQKKPKSDNCDEFGWDNFVLSAKKAKRKYVCAQIYNALGPEIAKELCPSEFESIHKTESAYLGGSLDHQSRIIIPDVEYAKQFLKFVERNDIVIYGGNDNDCLPIAGNHIPLAIFNHPPFWSGQTNIKKRHDEQYKFWSLYDKATGNKIRFSFEHDENGDKILPNKASIPELVDITITDYCEKECAHCYRHSNKQGTHAPLHRIKAIIDILSDLGTFELAIGGGEPTKHPDFWEIIDYCNLKNIVPNFTTADVSFINNMSDEQILRVGGIGLTVQWGFELNNEFFKSFYNRKPLWNGGPHALNKKLSLHVVCDLNDQALVTLPGIVSIANTLGITILLLGHKGKTKFKNDYVGFLRDGINSNWIDCRISVDSAFVAQYPEVHELADDILLTDIKEGSFSCYIDAVQCAIGPDSYSGLLQRLPEISAEAIKDIFKTC